MTTPVPARAHANMSVAEREFTFDTLLAEFGEDETVAGTAPRVRQAPDAAAANAPLVDTPRAAPQKWSQLARPLLTRPFAMPSAEVLKLIGLIALAAASLTLVFIAISR